MVTASTAIQQALQAKPPIGDGRRARSAASRTRIIEAMMDLVVQGYVNPSAAAVAERAGVGLRSVFRHFDDKESIFREIDRILMRAYLPIMEAPYASEVWQAQLDELIERRCEVSEASAPFRISGQLVRKRSAAVKQNFSRLHAREKAMLDDILPEKLRTNTRFGRAIMVAMSFDSWRLLRHDEELSEHETVNAIKDMVACILTQAGV